MDLSIIIVNWNTRDQLRDCLASLAGAVGDLDCEVLVVDNASRDGSSRMVRDEFPDFDVIDSGGNIGFSRANNLALARARGERLLLLNPDTVCAAGVLAELAAELDRLDDAMAVGPALVDEGQLPTASFGDFPSLAHHLLGTLLPSGRRLPRSWRDHGFGRVPRIGGRPREVDYVKGACLMMSREAFEKVGALDERFFMYFEETDWCRRAREAGGRIWLVPALRVAHLEGRSAEQVGDFSRRQFHHSYRLYLAKHGPQWRVTLYRAAMWLEFTVKGCLRRLAPGGDRQRNRATAKGHFATAHLQLQRDIAPTPPAE